jgi:hypothetical protein
MDIDNSRVTWDLDKTCKASNVSMLTGTDPASLDPASSIDSDLHKSIPVEQACDCSPITNRVLSAFHSGDRIEYTKSDPMGASQFSFAKVQERNFVYTNSTACGARKLPWWYHPEPRRMHA